MAVPVPVGSTLVKVGLALLHVVPQEPPFAVPVHTYVATPQASTGMVVVTAVSTRVPPAKEGHKGVQGRGGKGEVLASKRKRRRSGALITRKL